MKINLIKKNPINLLFHFFILLRILMIISNHKLIDENDYSFKAIYHSDKDNENVPLISKIPGEITKMIIEEEEVEPCKEYTFQNSGTHIIYVLLDLSTSNSLSYMLQNIKKLDSIVFTSSFNTENITSLIWMFYGCSSLTSADISNFNSKSVTSMARMFYDCQSLISVDFSKFETPNLKSLEGLFIRGYSLTSVNFGKNFDTSKVTDMGSLFFNCCEIESIDISKFDTSSLIIAKMMFYGCKKIKKINISNFNTLNVKDMDSIFNECSSLTSMDLSNFNFKNLENLNRAFYGCSSLEFIGLNNINAPKLTDINEMFQGCTSLKKLILLLLKFNIYKICLVLFMDVQQ